MELQFEKRDVTCLDSVLSQVQNLEQTQEVRIPTGMPGAARVLGTWGQILMRSKEWRSDEILFSGGVQVWILYEPEDGSSPKCLESWIPFQLNWDLPDNVPEGYIQIQPLLRFADARLISAEKILVRAGVAVLAEAWSEGTRTVFQPQSQNGDVELLQSSWPMLLMKEAGEKTFRMEETLTMPPSVPHPEKLVYYRMEPALGDKKVLGNKLVFRGNCNLHILYLCEDGQLHSWDFELPFSQYAELKHSHSQDARGDVLVVPTLLEMELNDEGGFQMHSDAAAQYQVQDREILELAEDAYSPFREMDVHREQLQMPALLESRRVNIYGEQTIPVQADVVADATFLPDFPRQNRGPEGITLQQPGMVQLMYYDGNGRLQSASQRWEWNYQLNADENTQISAAPILPSQLQVMPGGEEITLRGDIPVQISAFSGQALPMVTDVKLGEKRNLDPARPSLVLRRAGSGSLWEIARESGSTINAIRMANDISGEPEPGKMLLIPVM